jgi:hypothetical protein
MAWYLVKRTIRVKGVVLSWVQGPTSTAGLLPTKRIMHHAITTQRHGGT